MGESLRFPYFKSLSLNYHFLLNVHQSYFILITLFIYIYITHDLMVILAYMYYVIGTGYEYDGYVFVAWVLQVRRAEVVTNDQLVSGHGPLFYGN
jgi:hypothetical protein